MWKQSHPMVSQFMNWPQSSWFMATKHNEISWVGIRMLKINQWTGIWKKNQHSSKCRPRFSAFEIRTSADKPSLLTRSAPNPNRTQITHKSPKRHKKDTQAGKWTLLLHFSTYLGPHNFPCTFFLYSPLTLASKWIFFLSFSPDNKELLLNRQVK